VSTNPENLVKISLIGSEISKITLLQAIVKKEEKNKKESISSRT